MVWYAFVTTIILAQMYIKGLLVFSFLVGGYYSKPRNLILEGFHKYVAGRYEEAAVDGRY